MLGVDAEARLMAVQQGRRCGDYRDARAQAQHLRECSSWREPALELRHQVRKRDIDQTAAGEHQEVWHVFRCRFKQPPACYGARGGERPGHA